MDNIQYAVIGFDYTDHDHTETVIAHTGDPIESFNYLMKYFGYPTFTDAKKLRDSGRSESDQYYHLYDGWKRGVPNEILEG